MEIANESDSSSSSSSMMLCSFPNLHVTSSYGRENMLMKDFYQIFESGKFNCGVRASSSMDMSADDVDDVPECFDLHRCGPERLRKAEFYLTIHKNKDVLDRYGNTPLYWAAYFGQYETVEKLVEVLKFPVNWQNYSGDTALSAAVREGYVDIAKYLLVHGANPNIGNASEETPLHLAACQGRLDMCELLLMHGAYVDAIDEYGDTALHWAVREEAVEVIELLLQYGANPHHYNEDNESPEMLAQLIGCTFLDSIVKQSLDGESNEACISTFDEFDMMDVESYSDNYIDSEENSAIVIPSSIEEKPHLFVTGPLHHKQYA